MNEVAIRNESVFNRGIPSEHEMAVLQTIAKQAVESKLYNNFGGQGAIMMTVLAARELGIPPMLALNGGINNIQGKIEISARLMNALMRRAGISINIKESNDQRCVIEGKRGDNGDSACVTYTFAEAQKAGLVKASGGWVKNPIDMLFARAISRLARQIAPDVIGGCYIEGEIKAAEAEIIAPEPKETRNLVNELLQLFPTDDAPYLAEYTEIVMKHFGWTHEETLKEFLKDEKSLKEKFTTWKMKKYKIPEQKDESLAPSCVDPIVP